MTNKIQNKRSSTLNNPPASLDPGEIAINTNAASANVHFEDADGGMRSIGADPTVAGTYVRNVVSDGEVGTWVAANAVPGGGDGSGDFGFWSRNDTTDTVSPRIAGDNITTTGYVDAGDGGTFFRAGSAPAVAVKDSNDGNKRTTEISGNGDVKIGGTLPDSPNINLDPDGSGIFAGGQAVINSSGVVDIQSTTAAADASTLLRCGSANVTGGANAFVVKANGEGTFVGDVKIGGTLPSAPNISLSSGGAGTFVDQVTSGADPSGGAGTGSILNQTGVVKAGRATGSDVVWQGFTVGTGGATSTIDANGSAEFASNNFNIYKVDDGATLDIRRDSADNALTIFNGGMSPSNVRTQLRADGSALFDSHVTVGGNLDLTDSTIDLYSQTTTATSPTFQLFSDIGGVKTEKITFRADGSAIFTGSVFCNKESQVVVNPTITTATGDYYNFESSLVSNSTASTVTGYLASQTLSQNKGSATRVYGFRTNVTKGDDATPNYGFYAANNSFHWFGGRTAIGGTHGANPHPGAVLHVKSGNAEVMRIERDGNLNAAIGYTNSTGKLIYAGGTSTGDFAIHADPELNSAGAYLTVYRSSGKVDLGNPTVTSGVNNSLFVEGRLGSDKIRTYTSGSANVVVDANGLLQMAASSIRYKTDVETMEDVYADKIVDECRPVFYRPNPATADPDEEFDPTKSYWGFIAEEVEQVDPRLVWYGKDEEGNPRVDGVAYDSFAPVLLNVVKRQKDQIADLEARLSALEKA